MLMDNIEVRHEGRPRRGNMLTPSREGWQQSLVPYGKSSRYGRREGNQRWGGMWCENATCSVQR